MRPIPPALRAKMKCKQCKKYFIPTRIAGQKFCSQNCYFLGNTRIKDCFECKKQFSYLLNGCSRKFCTFKCFAENSKKTRLGKNNPNYRGGIWAKGGAFEYGSKTAGVHLRACSKYKKKFIKEHGFMFCEICNVSSAFKFETHHIYYASRFPKHVNLHNDKNLILLCHECHKKFHAGVYRDQFKRLEQDRGLKQLFV